MTEEAPDAPTKTGGPAPQKPLSEEDKARITALPAVYINQYATQTRRSLVQIALGEEGLGNTDVWRYLVLMRAEEARMLGGGLLSAAQEAEKDARVPWGLWTSSREEAPDTSA